MGERLMTVLHWVVTFFYLFIIYKIISLGFEFGLQELLDDINIRVIAVFFAPYLTFLLIDWIVTGKVTLSVLDRY